MLEWLVVLGVIFGLWSFFQVSHAINPSLCGKKGGGHKNVLVSKSLRCVSQRKLALEQNPGISMRKLALWPRKWCVSAGESNSLRPWEMKDLFSTAQVEIYTIMHPRQSWSDSSESWKTQSQYQIFNRPIDSFLRYFWRHDSTLDPVLPLYMNFFILFLVGIRWMHWIQVNSMDAV